MIMAKTEKRIPDIVSQFFCINEFLDINKMSIAIGCPHFFKRFHGFRLGSFEVESSAVLKEGLGKSNLGIGLSKFRFSSSFS